MQGKTKVSSSEIDNNQQDNNTQIDLDSDPQAGKSDSKHQGDH